MRMMMYHSIFLRKFEANGVEERFRYWRMVGRFWVIGWGWGSVGRRMIFRWRRRRWGQA